MAKYVAISTLGNYASYRAVHYRVYVEAGGRRRPEVVVTSYGPLAVLAANLLRNSRQEGHIPGEGSSFDMLLFAPITLMTTVVGSDEDKVEAKVREMVSEPCRLAESIVKGLEERVRESYEVYKRYSSKVGKTASSTVYFKVSQGSLQAGEKGSLPILAKFKANLVVEAEDTSTIEAQGAIRLALTPLTGSYLFKGHREAMALFREDSIDDVEVFGDAMRALVLSTLYRAYSSALTEFQEERDGDETLTLLVDTTHGINNVVSVVTSVVSDVLQLLRYEALSRGFTRFNTLFYNSDPFTPGGRISDEEALELTRSNNVSYYFHTITRPQPISAIADMVDWLALRPVEGVSESMKRLLRGIYLLRRGVMPWGLYMVETSKVENAASALENIVSIKVSKGKGGEVLVSFKIPGRARVKEYYNVLLAKWLSKLVSKAVKRLTERECKLKPIKMLEKPCWGEAVSNRDIRCYDLDFMSGLARPDGESRYSWEYMIIRSLMNDTARIIVRHEVKELKEDWISRLQYVAARILASQRHTTKTNCGNMLGGRGVKVGDGGESGTLYCVTPMIEQTEVRNVIAHAGLTSATRFIGFLFQTVKSEKGETCEIVGVCIASDIPESFFNELRAELEG